MEIKIQLVIEMYKEEVERLMNDNILLKAQVKQLQKDLNELNELNKGDKE